MIDMLAYIKDLLLFSTPSRKRKVPPVECEIPTTSKVRRISLSPMSSSQEDWYSFSSDRNLTSSRLGAKPKQNLPSKENIVNLDEDDDDDVIEISKPTLQSSKYVTSTPNHYFTQINQAEDDDVTLLKYTQPPELKKLSARRQGFDYIKPVSYLSSIGNNMREYNGSSKPEIPRPSIWRGTRDIKARLGINRSPPHSRALEQSFRLDEKLRYQQLLAKVTSDPSSFSKYALPSNKSFSSDTQGRGKKILDMVCNRDKPTIIDLTYDTNGLNKNQPRLTIKDKIKKVLDKYDNELTVVKDSDAEIEILPTPPSPKPDIKVDRINTFKRVVDSSEAASKEWLTNLIQTYKDKTRKYEQEIHTQLSHNEKLAKVTSEVQAQRLEDQLSKCLKIKDVVLPVEVSEETLFPELTDEDVVYINDALSERKNPNEVLAQKFNLNITRRDLMTLRGLNWLNDEIINFYMNLLIERGSVSKWPKVYAFNTFFYPKLLKDGPSSLRRWTRRIDLFAHDIVAIPIHLGVHWCMSIIDFRHKTIQYFDSMGSPNRQCLDALLSYLIAEHLDKKQSQFDTAGWELENVEDIPQQMNGSDCGMFACTFAEFVTRDAKITFNQEDMPYLRRKMVLEILTGELLIN